MARIPHAIPHKEGQDTVNYGEIKQGRLKSVLLLIKELMRWLNSAKEFKTVLKNPPVAMPCEFESRSRYQILQGVTVLGL